MTELSALVGCVGAKRSTELAHLTRQRRTQSEMPGFRPTGSCFLKPRWVHISAFSTSTISRTRFVSWFNARSVPARKTVDGSRWVFVSYDHCRDVRSKRFTEAWQR